MDDKKINALTLDELENVVGGKQVKEVNNQEQKVETCTVGPAGVRREFEPADNN